MSTKPRPENCCEPVIAPPALGADERELLVARLKALADPSRLEIYRLIAAQAAPICVCDVVGRFDLTQPTISHHLKVLREAGLITVSRLGVWAYYQADPRAARSFQAMLAHVTPATVEAAA
jgi:ArsR family transcriptional regulator